MRNLGRAVSRATVRRSWFVLILAFGVPTMVLAQPRAPGVRERRLIDLIVVASGDAKGDENTLATPLRRMGLEVRFLRSDTFEPNLHGTPDVFAKAYVDLRPTAQPVVLVLVDGPTGRVLVRRSITREGSDEVVREQVALILESVVESALRQANSPASASASVSASAIASASANVGVASASAVASSTPPSPPAGATTPIAPAAPLRLHLDIAPFVSLHSLGKGADRTPGGGVAIAGGARNLALSPGLMLMGRVQASSVSDSHDVLLKTAVASMRLFPTLDPFSTRRVSFQIGLGPGVDVVAANVERGGATPRHPSKSVSWVGSGLLAASFWITPEVSFFAAGMLDLDLTPHRFVVMTPGGPEAIVESERVRMNLLLGLSFTVAGSGHE